MSSQIKAVVKLLDIKVRYERGAEVRERDYFKVRVNPQVMELQSKIQAFFRPESFDRERNRYRIYFFDEPDFNLILKMR